uniref:Palmitoyltransferase n=1 Tax=Kwoniella dejecticola CBS 10117 TaxID=1296121 RepID=A0A1A6AC98_9TREE|nr:uncharacterized protein I303_01883 [Kwoniella dejecticola CBS 10117]OBR87675.1 hypothetical protein I303_01883 [Kwoniella dejecticola CBS 10117]
MPETYGDSSASKRSRRSRLDRFLNRVPYYFSYVILVSTWLLFTLFITIGEVLLKRREIGRFLEQVIIYNSLLLLTLISLATTANRSPGKPDQTLAPPLRSSRIQLGASNPRQTIFDQSQESNNNDADDDDDNVPLRYLKNDRWVNSRIGKDRPSPLPLPSHRPTLPLSAQPSPSASDDSESDYSPFPLSAKGPFVPASALDAGEEEGDVLEETRLLQSSERQADGVEHESSSSLHDVSGTHGRSGRAGRSLMAKSNNGESRWCKKCRGWKPDRCHHCRHCEQCILRMDHHCPWVGNCVGYHNYKPFFLFINYALLLALYATFQAGYESYRFFQDPSGAMPYRPVQLEANSTSDGLGISPAIFMMLTVMGGFMGLAVGSLVVFHWYLALSNQTTLENITHAYPAALLDEVPQNTQAQWKADHLLTRDERRRLKHQAREINVYDLGWRKNLKNLFFGEGRGVTVIGIIGAFWPAGRPHRHDRRAGHFFDYNPEHFDKLRELTLELRYGIVPEHRAQERKSFEETGPENGSLDGSEEDEYELDQMEEKGLTRDANGQSQRKVKWFEV